MDGKLESCSWWDGKRDCDKERLYGNLTKKTNKKASEWKKMKDEQYKTSWKTEMQTTQATNK